MSPAGVRAYEASWPHADLRAASRRGRVLSLGIALVMAGCSGAGAEHQQDASAPGPPQFELGQGELAFASLSDDEALPYVAGSQGGQHVFVSFRVRNLDPMRVQVQVTTAVIDHPELVLMRAGRVNFSLASETDTGTGMLVDSGTAQSDSSAIATASDSYVFAGWPAQILMAPCHVGEAVRIHATLTDLQMQSVSDTRTIRIAMSASSPKPVCPGD